MSPSQTPASLKRLDAGTGPALRIAGDWVLADYSRLEREVLRLQAEIARAQGDGRAQAFDLSGLGRLDTAGAALLVRLLGAERAAALDGLPARQQALLTLVARSQAGQAPLPVARPRAAGLDLLERIGARMVAHWRELVEMLGFIGLVLQALFGYLLRPRRWRLTSLAAHLEQTCLNALPIVALLTFLVGAVVSFLGATVLKDFGASIYTVNLVTFAFLREFGVLLAAILISGRTASAFAAQIGSMRANEEVDAIRALGLEPVELLVLPRVVALLIALPILTFIGMLSGILGGIAVCALNLEISPAMFLDIFQRDIRLRHFLVGLAKAPVLALLIAVIGCMEGFKVSGSAQSVGEHTTSAVVKSIFVVILLDALAALFYMEMGW